MYSTNAPFFTTPVCAPPGNLSLALLLVPTAKNSCSQELPWLQECSMGHIPSANTTASTSACEEHSLAQLQDTY